MFLNLPEEKTLSLRFVEYWIGRRERRRGRFDEQFMCGDRKKNRPGASSWSPCRRLMS